MVHSVIQTIIKKFQPTKKWCPTGPKKKKEDNWEGKSFTKYDAKY